MESILNAGFFDRGSSEVMGIRVLNVAKHRPEESLQKMLDEAGFRGSYDFLYLPMKFISKLPFGHSDREVLKITGKKSMQDGQGGSSSKLGLK